LQQLVSSDFFEILQNLKPPEEVDTWEVLKNLKLVKEDISR
jgi:hypothetical protein